MGPDIALTLPRASVHACAPAPLTRRATTPSLGGTPSSGGVAVAPAALHPPLEPRHAHWQVTLDATAGEEPPPPGAAGTSDGAAAAGGGGRRRVGSVPRQRSFYVPPTAEDEEDEEEQLIAASQQQAAAAAAARAEAAKGGAASKAVAGAPGTQPSEDQQQPQRQCNGHAAQHEQQQQLSEPEDEEQRLQQEQEQEALRERLLAQEAIAQRAGSAEIDLATIIPAPPPPPPPPAVPPRTALDDTPIFVRPGLYIGSMLAERNRKHLRGAHITDILQVAEGLYPNHPLHFNYMNLQVQDWPGEDLVVHFPKCFEFIDAAIARKGNVLVHCAGGISRSATVVLGYLMSRHGLNLDESLRQLRTARPEANPNAGFAAQLRELERLGSDPAKWRAWRHLCPKEWLEGAPTVVIGGVGTVASGPNGHQQCVISIGPPPGEGSGVGGGGATPDLSRLSI